MQNSKLKQEVQKKSVKLYSSLHREELLPIIYLLRYLQIPYELEYITNWE